MRPADAHATAIFTFDVDAEEVWIADDPSNAERPGVLSQGTYDTKVGVPLVLELLERTDVRATFFVVGRVAERYPATVRDIVAAGHEIGHHGYTHASPSRLTPDEEAAELIKGREVLESFGAAVTGYRSPSWEFSHDTLRLLSEHGFAYSSNFMDDIRPYRHAEGGIVELPVHWILDDAVHFWFSDDCWTKKISTVEEVRSLWVAEFEGIARLDGVCVFTMHPQFIARPGRIGLLESMLTAVKETPGVWLATADEVARDVLERET